MYKKKNHINPQLDIYIKEESRMTDSSLIFLLPICPEEYKVRQYILLSHKIRKVSYSIYVFLGGNPITFYKCNKNHIPFCHCHGVSFLTTWWQNWTTLWTKLKSLRKLFTLGSSISIQVFSSPVIFIFPVRRTCISASRLIFEDL